MPGLKGYALVQEVETEIVSAYAAGLQTFPAVATAPGWFQVGSFFLPKTVVTRLEAIGSKSHSSLLVSVKLVDSATGADVSGSLVTINSLSELRVLSGVFEIVGQKTYSILAQAVGSAGADRFGTVSTASLVGP